MKNIFRFLLTHRDIFLKILLPAFLTIGLFLGFFFLFLIPRYEEVIIDRKREMSTELTRTALSILNTQYQLEKSGKLTREQAQKNAIEQFNSLRYGQESKDYFWITDFSPKMIVHPFRPELNNSDLSDYKDKEGKLLFVEIAELIKKQHEGFVTYMWQWKDDSTKVVPKLSFVKGFPEWGWITGTGLYMEDVRLEVEQLESNILLTSFSILGIVSILIGFIAFQNIRIEQLREKAESDLQKSREQYRALVEASTEGLILLISGSAPYFNKEMYTLSGYSESDPEVIQIDSLFETLTGEPLSLNSSIQKLHQIEGVLVKKSGLRVRSLLMISPIQIQGNNGIIITVRDISTHKETELALGQSIEQYTALTSILNIGTFRAAASKSLIISECNPAFLKILGLPLSTQTESIALSDYFLHEDELSDGISGLFMSGSIISKAFELKKPDGSIIACELSAVLIKDSSGKPVSCEGIIEDRTESVKHEEEKQSLISKFDNEGIILSRPVSLFSKPCTSVLMTDSVATAAAIMTESKSTALIISSQDGQSIGILTDNDIRERVIAQSESPESPVYRYMSSPLVSVTPETSLLEALIVMQKKSVQHLLVKQQDNTFVGIYEFSYDNSTGYLAYLQLFRQLSTASSVNEISRTAATLRRMTAYLISEVAVAEVIASQLTLIADSVLERLIQLAMNKLGIPPVSFAFLALGSEGRREQLFATDQDNAIIFQDVPESELPTVLHYFQSLATFVCQGLQSCGYTLCRGNIMAMNPKWCQPASVWKDYFHQWITTATPNEILDINIFFDFRCAYGEEHLVETLRHHVQSLATGNNSLFVYLTQGILNVSPSFVSSGNSELIDIKTGTRPIIDAARAYSILHGIQATGTAERLKNICQKGIISNSLQRDILYGFNYAMRLRILHQIRLLDANSVPDNVIKDDELLEFDRLILKRTVQTIRTLQSKISLDSKGTL